MLFRKIPVNPGNCQAENEHQYGRRSDSKVDRCHRVYFWVQLITDSGYPYQYFYYISDQIFLNVFKAGGRRKPFPEYFIDGFGNRHFHFNILINQVYGF